MAAIPRWAATALVALAMFAVAPVAMVSVAAAAPADGVNQECNGAFQGNPDGSLAIAGSPAAGSVGPNVDQLTVTASWNTADWSGATLDKILDCVTIDGVLRDSLSSIDKPTANDGAQTFTIDVDGLAPGTDVCARVRLSGQPAGNNVSTQKSNVLCWKVVEGTTQPDPTPSTYSCAKPTVNGRTVTLGGETDNAAADGGFFTVTPTIGKVNGSLASKKLGAALDNVANGTYTYTASFTQAATTLGTGSGAACTFTVDVAAQSATETGPAVSGSQDPSTPTGSATVLGVQIARESSPAPAPAAPAAAGVELAATGSSGRPLTAGLALVVAGLLLVIGAHSPRRPPGLHYRT